MVGGSLRASLICEHIGFAEAVNPRRRVLRYTKRGGACGRWEPVDEYDDAGHAATCPVIC